MATIASYGNNDQIILDGTVLGATLTLDLIPETGDDKFDYKLPIPPADPTGAPERLLVPGVHDDEKRRLAGAIVKRLESEVAIGLAANDNVVMAVDTTVTPSWDAQVREVFYNAAKARINTHKFQGARNPVTGVNTYGVALV